ncbi:MAG TPA: efflux RND transporter periplasmic adaptor subunit [Candidatus Acidoferrales bacterium]|nr:efflux RND transporter periplasmic adaptor subunit [Candidatus Acidoferrales bacterium]
MNETNTAEERLRAEVEDLRRQLEEQKKLHESGGHPRKGPSAASLVLIAVVIIALIVVGFFAGYLPRQRREQVLAAETRDTVHSLPAVNFSRVERSATKTELVLPGNVQAVTEAPILARATGYIRKRYVDIGDRVRDGQVVAEIEAPELDQMILQANATLEQTRSAVQQAEAAVQQGRANENLARVTAQRWDNLQKRGVVSKQENDTYQAQWAAQQANVQALEKALAAAHSNVAAAEANFARLNQLKTYQAVRAPFDGIITVRNIDTGVLVNEGNTLLFRIAQTGTLRVYVNLPQSEADSVRVGQQATLAVAELPGRKFVGTVTRTSNALDPASRTLLTEVQVPNPAAQLLPGMYADVDLSVPRQNPPLLIPGDTLVVRSDGPQVAVIGPEDTVHFTRIKLGRDYGDRLEVLSGLDEGQRLVANPSDEVREGVKVKPVAVEKAPGKKQ